MIPKSYKKSVVFVKNKISFVLIDMSLGDKKKPR